MSDHTYLTYPFLRNKYYNQYSRIIQRCQANPIKDCGGCYTETHHILPESLGGLTIPDNLVILTTKEHFIVHALLVRCTEGTDKCSMVYALHLMCVADKSKEQTRKNSRLYEINRREYVKQITGRKNSPEHIEKTRQFHLGRTRSKETCDKIREKAILRYQDPLLRIEMSKRAKRMWDDPEFRQRKRESNIQRRHPEDTKKKISDSLLEYWSDNTRSPESREKTSQAHLKFWSNKTRSPENREKIREGLLRYHREKREAALLNL